MNKIRKIYKSNNKQLQTLLNVLFPNGVRVEVTNMGVTLWDHAEGRWILDHSWVCEPETMEISDEIKKVKRAKWEKPCYEVLYPETKKKLKKTKP